MCLAMRLASAHAPPTPIPALPIHVQGNSLVDAKGVPFVLRGVQFPSLVNGTSFAFQIIQQRWNMNAVRLPVSVAAWKSDPQNYMAQVTSVVRTANAQQLIVVLGAFGSDGSGLPTADVTDFWRAAAVQFKGSPGLIFSLFAEPSTSNI